MDSNRTITLPVRSCTYSSISLSFDRRKGRKTGLIRYTLNHFQEHHNLEDVLWIAGNAPSGNDAVP